MRVGSAYVRLVASLVLATGAYFTHASIAAYGTGTSESGGGSFAALPGAAIPAVRTHRYTMAGAVRPLLFWINREDVGIGRIVWHAGADGARGYELLVGTDPDRAPRGLNRWGYVAEEEGRDGGTLLALMTGSHETSYEAESAAARQGAGDGELHVIRARTVSGQASWILGRVRTERALTVQHLPDALIRVQRGDASAPLRERRVASNAHPGLLTAVADLLNEVLASGGTVVRAPARSVPYAFGSRTYALRVRDIDSTEVSTHGRKVPARRLVYETRNVESGDTSRFEVTVGTAGELAGVPLVIEWQPRWWLRVRLTLDDDMRAASIG